MSEGRGQSHSPLGLDGPGRNLTYAAPTRVSAVGSGSEGGPETVCQGAGCVAFDGGGDRLGDVRLKNRSLGVLECGGGHLEVSG